MSYYLVMILHSINDFLRAELAVAKFPVSEQGGVYQPSDRPVHRIGLALEPPSRVGDWVRANELDALWLHRPWQLNLATLPPGVGVLYHHLPFDETLTTGYNIRLAAALAFLSYNRWAIKLPQTPPMPTGRLVLLV